MELMDIVAELKNASVQMPEEKIDQFIEAVARQPIPTPPHRLPPRSRTSLPLP